MRSYYRVIDGKLEQVGGCSKAQFVEGVIADQMEATKHPADKQYYTSKRAFRKATKRAGCVEVGTEWEKDEPEPQKEFKFSKEYKEKLKRRIWQIMSKC